jgi:hypothetical protein
MLSLHLQHASILCHHVVDYVVRVDTNLFNVLFDALATMALRLAFEILGTLGFMLDTFCIKQSLKCQGFHESKPERYVTITMEVFKIVFAVHSKHSAFRAFGSWSCHVIWSDYIN